MKFQRKVILVVIALVLLVSVISTVLIVRKEKEEDHEVVEIMDENSLSLSTNHIILDHQSIGQAQKITIKSLCSMEEIDYQVQFATMTNLNLEEYITYEVKDYEIKIVCSQPFADPIILTVFNQVNQAQCQIDCLQDVCKLNASIICGSFNCPLDAEKRIAIPLCQENAVYELKVVGEYDSYSLARDCPVQCHLYLANEVQAALKEELIQYQVQYNFEPKEGLNLTLVKVQEMFQLSKDFLEWESLFTVDNVIFILEIEMGSYSELYSIYYEEHLPTSITSIVLTENMIIF